MYCQSRAICWLVLFAVGCGGDVTPLRAETPDDRYAISDKPVVYLNQNWTADESLAFYSLRQGSPIIRKELFDALEQPDGNELFRNNDYLARLGFLPQQPHALNPDGYPIGFVARESLEINCAACHTSRLTFGDKEYRIDGSQAMSDVETWLAELVRAMQQTLADAPAWQTLSPSSRVTLDPNTKFGRFAERVLGEPNPTASRAFALFESLRSNLERRQRYNDYNDFGTVPDSAATRAGMEKHVAYGFGRIDALGAILNQASAEAIRMPANAAKADAPVNYPVIWDAPQHKLVQWNGAVDNSRRLGPLARNTGQVVGVFGLVDGTQEVLGGYESSVNRRALEQAESLVTRLWSPEWPEEFGRDNTLVERGRVVYAAACIDCHALIDRDAPDRLANEVLVPISQPYRTYPPLDTDPLAAANWSLRDAQVGPLAGRFVSLPLGDRLPDNFTARIPARDVLTHVVFKVIARTFVPWREELTIEEPADRRFLLRAVAQRDEWMRYKARPLNGVWCSAPYLHNGSVLNMAELLKPPAERKPTFRVGSADYVPATLGFEDAGPFLFDTRLPGNNNRGHTYGADRTAEEKQALLEYLKSL